MHRDKHSTGGAVTPGTVTGEDSAQAPDISLVVPVYNEEECIRTVLEEAAHVLDALPQTYEILVVDDGSTDETPALLEELRSRMPALRVIALTPNSGQSAAFGAAFRRCRGRVAVLMDGDGQNDPHDIPELLAALNNHDACCGHRVLRRDTFSKRIGSRMANRVRRLALRDGIRDTGCSLKAIRVDFLRELPMALRGMHRFLPVLLRLQGARITQIPVGHRPRAGGASKYTNLGRLMETVWDLWALRWMQRRHRRFSAVERREKGTERVS